MSPDLVISPSEGEKKFPTERVRVSDETLADVALSLALAATDIKKGDHIQQELTRLATAMDRVATKTS